MRKEANYNVTDRIKISISGITHVIESFGDLINSETLSKFDTINTPDLEKSETLDGDISINIKIVR